MKDFNKGRPSIRFGVDSSTCLGGEQYQNRSDALSLLADHIFRDEVNQTDPGFDGLFKHFFKGTDMVLNRSCNFL